MKKCIIVAILLFGLVSAEINLDNVKGKVKSAFGQVMKGLGEAGTFFKTKYKDLSSIVSNNTGIMRKRIDYLDTLLTQLKEKKNEISKDASKETKEALANVDKWQKEVHDLNAKVKKDSSMKFDEMKKLWEEVKNKIDEKKFSDLLKLLNNGSLNLLPSVMLVLTTILVAGWNGF